MAITCDPGTLNTQAALLNQEMTHKGILAGILYVLCTSNGMNCTPQSLNSLSSCIQCNMTEKGILASILYVLCSTGGGGGGAVSCGTGAPTTPPPTGCGFYIQTDSLPQPGVIWEYYNGSWH